MAKARGKKELGAWALRAWILQGWSWGLMAHARSQAGFQTVGAAIKKLQMGNNRMATKETGRALAEALEQNSVLKELDVSSWVAPAPVCTVAPNHANGTTRRFATAA